MHAPPALRCGSGPTYSPGTFRKAYNYRGVSGAGVDERIDLPLPRIGYPSDLEHTQENCADCEGSTLVERWLVQVNRCEVRAYIRRGRPELGGLTVWCCAHMYRAVRIEVSRAGQILSARQSCLQVLEDLTQSQ
ncbi:hypothetical protein J1614_003050 [Plenodomus biglobosus]|nr:hypothetical protein J1614_003050 [Plenodomus biglobosus]